jgi:hypothetical protein
MVTVAGRTPDIVGLSRSEPVEDLVRSLLRIDASGPRWLPTNEASDEALGEVGVCGGADDSAVEPVRSREMTSGVTRIEGDVPEGGCRMATGSR